MVTETAHACQVVLILSLQGNRLKFEQVIIEMPGQVTAAQSDPSDQTTRLMTMIVIHAGTSGPKARPILAVKSGDMVESTKEEVHMIGQHLRRETVRLFDPRQRNVSETLVSLSQDLDLRHRQSLLGRNHKLL